MPLIPLQAQIEVCGPPLAPRHIASIPDEARIFGDNFGNRYAPQEIRFGVDEGCDMPTPCDCSAFTDIDIPGLSNSYFNIHFEDVALGLPIGFNDPVEGYDNRKILCQVFADISNHLINRAESPCGDDPVKVNIEVRNSTSQDFDGALAVGGFNIRLFNHGGVLDGLPWQILNSGQNPLPLEDEELVHGVVVVNFLDYGFYNGPVGTISSESELYDLYSVIYHEALHVLGFQAGMLTCDSPGSCLSVAGQPVIGSSWFRFATFLHSAVAGIPPNVIKQNLMSSVWYNWELQVTGSQLFGACGVNQIDFAHPSGESYAIYHEYGRSAFSHLESSCDLMASYLMDFSLLDGTFIPISLTEKKMLCALGYDIIGLEDCGCSPVATMDIGPACTDDAFVLDLCEGTSEYLDIAVAELLDNDFGTSLELTSVEPYSNDDGSVQIVDGIIRFTPDPCKTGYHRLKYTVTDADCGASYSVGIVQILVPRCAPECSFVSDPNLLVDGGYNKNPCNLICNPEVFSNYPETLMPNICGNNCEGSDFWEFPGWVAAVQTPQYHPDISVLPNSGSLLIQSGGLANNQESVYTSLNLEEEGNYFLGFYQRLDATVSGVQYPLALNTYLVDNFLVDQFDLNETSTFCGILVNNEDLSFSQNNVDVLINALPVGAATFTRTGACFNVPENNDKNALWIFADYNEVELGNQFVGLIIDQTEVVKDDFTAGEDAVTICGDPVSLGGEDFCMLSDVLVTYTWMEGANALLTYSVILDWDGTKEIRDAQDNPLTEIPKLSVSPVVNTVYTLTRQIDFPGLTNPNDCVLSDDVLVEVIDDDDATFQYQVCDFTVSCQANTQAGTHLWDFGNGALATAANVTYTYPAAGDYTITHTVGEGGLCNIPATVMVHIPTPDAAFSPQSGNCENGFTTWTFEADEEQGTHSWTFGDGTEATSGLSVSHSYLPGTYTVTHTVETAGCPPATASTIIVVGDCVDCTECQSAIIGTENGTIDISDVIANEDLPPSNSNGLDACIAGTLVLSDDYTFSGSNLRMQPGARILVKNNSTLTIESSYLHGCTRMWRGIELEPGATLIVQDNSTVADAQYAIYADVLAASETEWINIELTDAHFLRNYVSVYIAPPLAFKQRYVNLHAIDNLFNGGTANLLTPFNGQTAVQEGLPAQNNKALSGIWLNDMYNLSLLGNTFTNMTTGLVGYNSFFEMEDNDFDQIASNSASYPTLNIRGTAVYVEAGGITAVNNHFKDCPNGITTDRSVNLVVENDFFLVTNAISIHLPYKDLRINDNLIDKTGIGIYVSHNEVYNFSIFEVLRNEIVKTSLSNRPALVLNQIKAPENQDRARVEENELTIELGDGIALSSNSRVQLVDNTIAMLSTNCRYGIALRGCKAILLDQNTVLGAGTGGDVNTALYVIQSNDCTYCCNTLKTTRIGARFEGGCFNLDAFRGNTFENHETGLLLEENAILGTQFHTQNSWSGTYGSGFGAIHESTNILFVLGSKFTVANNPSSYSPAFTPGGWFILGNDPDDPGTACSVLSCEPDQPLAESEELLAIAEGELDPPLFADAINWELHRYLYSEWYGTSLQDSALQTFMTAQLNTSVGRFDSIARAVEAVYAADSLLQYALGDTLLLLQGALGGLLKKDQAWQSGAISRGVWRQTKAYLSDQILAWSLDLDTLYQSIQQNRSLLLPGIKADNQLIPAAPGYELNRKRYNAAWLSALPYGTYKGLSTQQLNQLAQIAAQCPLEGGNAVYEARDFLALIAGKLSDYDDENLCYGNQHIARGIENTFGSEQEEGIIVFPNPASRSLNLLVPASVETPLLFQLYDLSGRLVLEAQLRTNEAIIDISLLDGGLYFYEINAAGDSLIRGKVMIVP